MWLKDTAQIFTKVKTLCTNTTDTMSSSRSSCVISQVDVCYIIICCIVAGTLSIFHSFDVAQSMIIRIKRYITIRPVNTSLLIDDIFYLNIVLNYIRKFRKTNILKLFLTLLRSIIDGIFCRYIVQEISADLNISCVISYVYSVVL